MTNCKTIRLATIRESGVEWLERHANGVLFWKADDAIGSCSFAFDLEAATEFMGRAGRTFDVSRLPYPVVLQPYEAWV